MRENDFHEVLSKAIIGDQSSLRIIFDLYMPLINKHSVIDGKIDEDCKQYILIKIALKISKFKI